MECKAHLKSFSPPSTKDVLGDHLHQKVSEALNKHFPNTKIHCESELKPEDRVTGMLLERSEIEIRKMLQDEIFLLKHVDLALGVCEENCSALVADRKAGYSYEELGEILFDKVSETEDKLAPQITGMLLELDVRTLLGLLSSDTLLKDAVKKAREALVSTSLSFRDSPLTSQKGSLFASDKPDVKQQNSNVSTAEKRDKSDQILKEACGVQLFEEVFKIYPKDASKITGMILELDLTTVQTLLRDKHHLMTAVSKAHSALHSSVQS